MPIRKIQKISIIGAGNVATRLALAMGKLGIPVSQVYNRSVGHGLTLARKVGADYTGSLEEMEQHEGLFLIAVSDYAVPEITACLRIKKGLVAHTSGALGMDILEPVGPRTGVFYPLQTFRKERKLNMANIPICIEAASSSDEHLLSILGKQLTGRVIALSSAQRRLLHLSAVFAGNFPNYLYAIAEDLLNKESIPFDLLEPLIRQTSQNAHRGNLFAQLTGPAVRNDREVMEMHLKLLERDPAFRRIYELISKSIIQYHQTHG